MKKVLLSLAIFFSIPAFSQSADERIGTCLNQSDWFKLEENYSVLKDSMQADFLKLMAEILIDYHFNHRGEALEGIQKLLTNHQQEIGGQNALNMAILACQATGLKGDYLSAAQNAQSIISQLKAQNAEKESYEGVEQIFHFYDRLKSIPPPSITRPDGDISVPIEIEKLKLPTSIEPKGWRGTTILIPVKIKGNTYRFIFDTGAGTCFMSEQFARKVGVRILNDSLVINATLPGAAQGQMGTLDSMQIGDMVFHYPLITIAPPNTLDSVLKVDAVLGMDFINLFEELRIYPKEGKIVFPASPTPLPSSGRNLMLSERMLNMKAEANGETLKFQFDTGNSTAGLHYPYYESHKSQLDASAKREQLIGGGFNQVVAKEILRLPSFQIEVGKVPVELKNLMVEIADYDTRQSDEMGNIGMDMITPFECVTINLKEMFLKLE